MKRVSARAVGVALALLALVLQSLAPVAVAPPNGQPVHFAHAHHAGTDGHAAHIGGAPPPEDAECPVCKSLAAAGAGIAAPLAVLLVAFTLSAPDTLKRAPERVRDRAGGSHRARAPPMIA